MAKEIQAQDDEISILWLLVVLGTLLLFTYMTGCAGAPTPTKAICQECRAAGKCCTTCGDQSECCCKTNPHECKCPPTPRSPR